MGELLTHPHCVPAASHFSHEQQRLFMLAQLRSYGPAFDYELIASGKVRDPSDRAAELRAEGFHIEALRRYRPAHETPSGWAILYVLRVKHPDTGEVIAAPVSVGMPVPIEKWTDRTQAG